MRYVRRQDGFTLLELVLVMVVICTVLAMIAPSLSRFWAGSQVNEAANQMVAVARLARTRAITDANTYRLNIDTKEGAFWLTMQQQEEWVDLGSGEGRHFSLPQGVRIELQRVVPGDEDCIDFRPNGQTDPATIRLIGPKGDLVQIVCRTPAELFAVAENTGGQN